MQIAQQQRGTGAPETQLRELASILKWVFPRKKKISVRVRVKVTHTPLSKPNAPHCFTFALSGSFL